MKVTLMSWNIWGGIMLPGLAEYLSHSPADIIALQEVQEEEGTNTAEKLALAVGYRVSYLFSAEYPWEGKMTRRGNAVLSKYPITATHRYELSSIRPRTALGTDILIGDMTIHIVSAHLVPNFPDTPHLQREQVTVLLGALGGNNTIIMGDFNATPESESIQLMGRHFHDTDHRQLPTWCLYPDGPGTAKKESVTAKYDYIWATDDLTLTNFAVGDSMASDHLPVSATLILP
jgi:endonuclease/exonuclease/phosphatase family metal-dependent hydrolase